MGKPKGNIQTDSEMDESNALIVQNHLYGKDLDASEKVSAIVSAISENLIDIPKQIRLSDTEQVKSVTKRYLRSCYRTGVIPSKTGLARACGCTRNGLDKFVREHPGHATSEYLQICFEAFAEMLSMSSLTGGNHAIVGIFLLKAMYGFKDNLPLSEPLIDSPLGVPKPTEELIEKYMNMIDD